MKFTPATHQNLQHIMHIVREAQSYLASLDIDQWQDGYPDENLILNDIIDHNSYVIMDADNKIMATTAFITDHEPTYTTIDGKWLTSNNALYGVIHRMVVGNSFRKLGIAQYIFAECEQLLNKERIPSMRIDTHEDNKGMQDLLKKLDYSYCGIIYVENGDKRLAFEKLL